MLVKVRDEPVRVGSIVEERKHVHKQGSFTAVLSLIESFTVVLSRICFWVVAWLTCIPNVVA
jgi:hypothetical protein